MVSPTGSRLGRTDHPALPVTIPDIVAATVECVAAGADALHLHVRDDRGNHSLDTGLYAEALSELHKVVPALPVQITTEAAGKYDTNQQRKVVERLRPQRVSVSLREAVRSEEDGRRIYDFCREHQIEVQHIIYDKNDADILRHWQSQDVLSLHESVLLVMGRYGQSQAVRSTVLDDLLKNLPPVDRWMACAFGASEHANLIYAASLGGDVRVGFENSLTRADGTPWSSVAASVAALKRKLDPETCRTYSRAV